MVTVGPRNVLFAILGLTMSANVATQEGDMDVITIC